MAAFTGVSHVAGLVPPVVGEVLVVQIRPVPVSVEDIGTFQQDFTSLNVMLVRDPASRFLFFFGMMN